MAGEALLPRAPANYSLVRPAMRKRASEESRDPTVKSVPSSPDVPGSRVSLAPGGGVLIDGQGAPSEASTDGDRRRDGAGFDGSSRHRACNWRTSFRHVGTDGE